MKAQKKVLIALITIAITGCGQDLIDNVKESPSKFDTTLTNEQLFSNSSFCTETTWTKIKDPNGREVVQVDCKLRSTLPEYEKMLTQGVNQSIKDYSNGTNRLIEENEKIKEDIKLVSSFKTVQQIRDYRMVNLPKCGEAGSKGSLGLVMLSMNGLVNEKRKPNDEDVKPAVDLCVADMNNMINDNSKRIEKAKEKIKTYTVRVNEYANNIKRGLPVENDLIAQWSVSADEKNVVLGGMSLIQKSENGKEKSVQVYTDELLEQATNPSNNPLLSVYSLTGQSALADRVILLRKLINFR
ncbi:hypothetical protein [Photobacterium kishitanii]|uniref:Lipoprotein n=1 Tax=Photobacterium kishitanii TaxID=318456 RepID=A0A2T3KM17_9GAMM|nr:hypothetical protein [Photobacterium kishitanii]PSV00723.1 hypothetical protein C9J27_06160 [Photobacterium kishitanii]